jgi:spore coat polysaccharide biosynthesis protein SpsF (cytidylyltransferase family)
MPCSGPILGVVLARLDSARLPGKPLLDCGGLPLVAHCVERARRAALLQGLALATTDRPLDDPLAHWAAGQGLPVFRGATDDVAGRVLECGRHFQARYVLRINGDSPCLDPLLVDQGLALCDGQVDLVTNLPGRTFPYGVSFEAVRLEALAEAWATMSDPADREHVTRYFYQHPDRFRWAALTSPSPWLCAARLVVDTPLDLERFRTLCARLGPRASRAGFAEVAALAIELGLTQPAS